MTHLNFTPSEIAAWKASYSPEDAVGARIPLRMAADLLALHEEVERQHNELTAAYDRIVALTKPAE